MRHTGALLLAVSVLMSAPGWSQTTTGRLMGKTVDESGAVLPGVNITISSPALIGGAQVKTTDDRGEFLFLTLGPGTYSVKAESSGFVTQERNLVEVPLGGAAAITIAMPTGAFAGEIEVVDETPVVDPTQVNTGQVFRTDYMQDSAIGSESRMYNTLINQTAGVSGGGNWSGVSQSRVFGSTIGDNAYFIDGMDATNPVTGTTTAVLNFDAIGEIQLQSGGFEAEYGRATGGIINIVSKSGGNRFSGAFDARYRDGSFQESGDHFDASELSTKHQVFGATLGGPIVRDKIWFFASYGRINDENTPDGSPTTREQNGQNYLGKITWQIDPSWRLSAKYTTDPTTWDNWGASRYRRPESTGFKKGITEILSTELTSMLSNSLMWNTTLGTYNYESNIYPQIGELAPISHANYSTGVETVNYWNQQYWETNRKDFTTDLSWFVDDLAGSHEFKGGIEYSDLYYKGDECLTGTPNGERCVDDGVGFRFGDVTLGGTTIPWHMLEEHTSGPVEFTGAVWTAFAQDAWRLTRDLTLKIGLRYDAVTYDTNNGTQIADMAKVQPRLGFAWDIGGDAKNVLRGSWGRYLHPNRLTLAGQVTDAVEESYIWYSCSGFLPLVVGVPVGSPEECQAFASNSGWGYRTDNAAWDPYGWVLAPWQRFGTEPKQSDPNIRATYADELILAFEREVGTRSAIELTYIDKKTRDVVDDTCNGNWPSPSADAECEYYFMANFSELDRNYRGVTLRFETRKYSWLTLLTSYTYSSFKESVGYTQNSSDVLDVYPWHYDNVYGQSSPKHRIKLNGFFNIKGDWTVAFDGRWTSPEPWAPWENASDNPEIPYGTHLLEPPGSRYAYNAYRLDLQLSKGFRARGVRFVVIGSVFNALNSEQPTGVCTHISGCGSYEDGRPINVGDPDGWQNPRHYEVGFRVEF